VGSAALRAAARTERDERLRGPDHLAARVIPPAPRLTLLVKVPVLRRVTPRLAERLLPGSYWFELARLKHMDASLRQGVSSGARQAVLLGAGLDTFAQRHPELAGRVTVFEVDQPGPQTWKRQRLEALGYGVPDRLHTRAHRFEAELAGVRTFEVDHPVTALQKRDRVQAVFGGLPPHVRYVAADLNRGDLALRLEAAGYDPGLRTVVVWSGVTAYLDADGVDAVIRWFAEQAAPGSSIVFDYCVRDMVEGSDAYYGAARLRRHLARGGEPLRFGFTRGGMGEFLAERGLVQTSDLDSTELERQYLVDSRGRVAGRVYGFVGIADAKVPEGAE
jgi:O-methyltransferase involved in polyketide biosynthesis